jgi:hypothetical protein
MKRAKKKLALLDRVAGAPLFQHVGEPIDDKSVKAVPDWEACLKSLTGNKWVNIGTTISNRVNNQAEAARGAEWMSREWNELIDELNEAVEKRIGAAVKAVIRRNKLPQNFLYFVRGRFVMAALLEQFPDPPSSEWSDRVMHWYSLGHVPCGYTGAVPAGKSTDPTVLPELSQGKLMVF